MDCSGFMARNRLMAAWRVILSISFAIACTSTLFAFCAWADEIPSIAVGTPAELTAQADSLDLHRLYNPNTGEHFYTASSTEKDYLVKAGWRYEGVGWIAPETSDTPVYRLYSGTDHHYTTSATERDQLVARGWKNENIGWYSDDEKKYPVYRQFNPNVNVRAWHNNSGSHNFTTSKSENDQLVKAGWHAEGAAWYAIGEGHSVPSTGPTVSELRSKLNMTTSFRSSLHHGFKGADWQGYIMIHDTEGDTAAINIVNGWDNGAGVGAHFVINKDGSIVQCVDMNSIAHHAGFGDAGHNRQFRTTDESRDDKRGTVPIGSWAPDYGMNSYSIGIELVHVGGTGYYPEAQLVALDNLIAYIDGFYGFTSEIIDHKMWRTGNPDTSPEFAGYLANYRTIRRHA